MAFQVPASKASKGQDQFEFQIGEATFKVRKAKFVGIDELIHVESGPVALLEFFAGTAAAQAKAVRALDRDQLGALVAAWREDSATPTKEGSVE